MQAQPLHSPPMYSRSTSATFLPASFRIPTACSPVGPAPTITTSKRSGIRGSYAAAAPGRRFLSAAAAADVLATPEPIVAVPEGRIRSRPAEPPGAGAGGGGGK